MAVRNGVKVLKIPCGVGGLNGSPSLNIVPLTDLRQSNGIDYSADSWAKEGGAAKINTTVITDSPDVIGLKEFGAHKVAATSDGKIVTVVTGGIGVTLKTGLGTNKFSMFTESIGYGAAKRLFHFNAYNIPQVWDGTAGATTDMGSDGITPPEACVAALAGAGAGNVDNGTHSYVITFVNAHGETDGGTGSNVVTVADKATDGKVELTGIPVGIALVTSRKIYRTIAGDTGDYKLVGTLSDNTTTTYTDNIADSGLGASAPTENGAHTRPNDWTGTNQPSHGVIHRGRMWCWLNDRLYFSVLLNHEDFVNEGSGTFEIFPGEGDNLSAAISFADRLWLFKTPRGIYWIDDSSSDIGLWSTHKHHDDIGVDGPHCLAKTDLNVMFLSSQGRLHELTRVEKFGGIDSGALMPDKISKWLRENINYTKFAQARMETYPYKMETHLAITSTSSTQNDRRLVIDLHVPSNPRFRWSTRDTINSISLFTTATGQQKLMMGDGAGFIWEMDKSTKEKDGLGYNCLFETPEFSPVGMSQTNPLGTGETRVNLQYLEAVFEPKGVHDLNVDIYGDGEFKYTVQFQMGGDIGGSFPFQLDVDRLGGSTINNLRHKLYGDYRRIKLIGYNSTASEDFSIFELLLGVTLGSERA